MPQDQWHITPVLLLQAGVKSSLQTAGNDVLTQQQNLQAGNAFGLPATNPQVAFPTGTITTNDWFLPQVGAIWDVTDSDRCSPMSRKTSASSCPTPRAAISMAPRPGAWAASSPSTPSSRRRIRNGPGPMKPARAPAARSDLGPLTSIDGQANYYHVDFYNRLFNVATFNFINPNPSILVNVGGVTDDGVDIAGTLHFGEHFQFYDAVSWNQSHYDDNYSDCYRWRLHRGADRRQAGAARAELAESLHLLRQLGRV